MCVLGLGVRVRVFFVRLYRNKTQGLTHSLNADNCGRCQKRSSMFKSKYVSSNVSFHPISVLSNQNKINVVWGDMSFNAEG